MPKIGRYSGNEVCRILAAHGFVKVRQKGSHAVMQSRVDGVSVTVPVPLHDEIRTGTLRSIIRQSGLPRHVFEV